MKRHKKLVKWLLDKLTLWSIPDREDLVMHLISHVSFLAIPKQKCVYFSPVARMCGEICLSGNGLPVFEYTMFDKRIMNFVRVRVELSKPGRIHFSGQVFKDPDPETDEMPVEMDSFYRDPFYLFASHLFRYFPLFPKKDESYYEPIQTQMVEAKETIRGASSGAPAIHREDANNQRITADHTVCGAV